MSRRGRCRGWASLALGVSLGLATGCQTYLGGMTLPSNDYLRDNPDYIPQAPNFKLPRELQAQQAAARNLAGPPVVVPGANMGPLPVPPAPPSP